MKIIKVFAIKTKKVKDTNYSIFKIKFKNTSKIKFLYNIIRRVLISNIMRIKSLTHKIY